MLISFEAVNRKSTKKRVFLLHSFFISFFHHQQKLDKTGFEIHMKNRTGL